MKTCRVCLNTFEFDCFPKNYTYKDGRATICKSCASIETKRRRTAEPQKHKSKKFNTTEEHMNQLLAIKNCEICGSPAPKHWEHLAVDHCHKTGKIRGMLCNSCNVGLGKFKDNQDLLLKAIQYLKERA